MFGGQRGSGFARVAAGGLALVLVVSSCSNHDKGPAPSTRRCAVVQAPELSKLVDVDLTLLPAGKDRSTCRFTSSDQRVEVRLTITGPVEAGQASLPLTSPTAVAKLGDEAWVTNQNAPLDTQLVMRKAGTLLQVDLADEALTPKSRIAMATRIARAALPNLPLMKVKAPAGPRGELACKPFESDAVEKLMGGVVVVTPAAPVGSCRLTAAALNRTVNITVLIETSATKDELDSFVSAIPGRVSADLGSRPAYWLPSPTGESNGGNLDLLDGDRILQVSVIGVDFGEGDARGLATAIAQIAVAPR